MKRGLQSWVPGIRLFREYRVAWLPADLAAGFTLGAVMVPVGLAFGELAGLPLAGLYAAIFPLLAYALFGSSRQLIIGPDASMAALVATSVVPLAGGDAGRLAAMAGALAMMMGLVCIVGGLLRLGFMADFLAKPVIVGFMHGLAAVIFVGQLPKVLGIKISASETLDQILEISRRVGEIRGISFAIGTACVVIILSLKKWWSRIPGQIVALLAALAAVHFLHLDQKGVAVVGFIPQGLPKFRLPMLSWADFIDLCPLAFAAALMAFSDTVVTARGFASRNRYTIDANQEMIALGMGNIFAGVSQGLPVSGSGSRTAVAESSGSRTQVTSVAAAFVVAVVMIFLTGYLKELPSAALGGILIAAAYNLCNRREWSRMWRFNKLGFIGAVLTFAGIVGIDVMQGIVIGVLYSIVLVMRALAFPHDAVLGRIGEGGEFHDRKRRPEAQEISGMILYRFQAPLFFANCSQFRSRLEALVEASTQPVNCAVVDASGFFEIDLAGCETLIELHGEFQKRGIRLALANVHSRLKDALIRSGTMEVIGETSIFSTLDAAVDACRG